MNSTYTKISDELIKQCYEEAAGKHCLYCPCLEEECLRNLLELVEVMEND